MKIKYLLSFLLLWLFVPMALKAQCDANNFTITTTSGTCPADGNISVFLPGGAPCSGWQAILTNPNGVETIQNIPNSGGPINFGALAPGDYNIRLINGPTVVQYPSNPVQVATSYQTMSITSTNQAPSCPITASQYVPNGTLEITIDNGGTGPFLYEATSQFGVQSFGPTTNTSHTFGNMEGGESVSFTVTDMGCGVSQTQDPVIAANNVLASDYLGSIFKRMCAPNCNTYDPIFSAVVRSQDLMNNMQLPGNATISINGGPPQDLVFDHISPVVNVISFTFPPGIAENANYEVFFNDGCSTFGHSGTTLPIDDNLLKVETTFANDPDTCAEVHQVAPSSQIKIEQETYQMFCSTNSIAIEQETAPGVWSNVPLVTNGVVVNPLNLADFSPSYTLPGSGHYRIIATDDCHTLIEEFDALSGTNPLEAFEISSAQSILEGTGAMHFRRIPQDPTSTDVANDYVTIPSTTYQISPVPFTPSITINPAHPYTLGGTYTLNFPINYTTTTNAVIVGDLPPGEYEIVATDVCGNQSTKSYTVQETAAYAPSIQGISGCANSGSIVYDLVQTNVARHFLAGVEVELWTDNGSGALGTLVEGDILPHGYTGGFENLSDGDYILRFKGINFDSPISDGLFSAATSSNLNREYLVPVSIAPFENITATTTGAYCDLNDPSSGFIYSEITGGTPTYPIVFELFDAANPGIPLETYTETDMNVTNHTFQNVTNGSYVVRISTPCDGIDLNLDLILAPIQPTITSNTTLCSPGETVELSLDLPVSLFDIVWTDDQNNTVGTGSPITVSVAAPTTYTASYSFKPEFCPSASVNTDTVQIDFYPELTQVGSESTSCNASGADYTLTVELTGTPPYTVTGTGAPGTFIGNTWTSDPIAIDTDYHLSFEDTNGCNTLEVAGNAPNCCVFEVTCPTFPAMAVECYADLPSASILTKAEFEALGNADGSIGDSPCGIIEITAVNSSDTGSCGVNATRTYTVTEYEDTNANGIRDNGENVILNTSDCQQTITVEDITPPTFVEDLPADITVICDAVPQAVTLTAMDNCGSSVQVSFSEETIFSNVTDDFIIERLWEASDSCGNVELHQQIISVTQPEIETVPIVICVGDDAIDLVDSLPQGFDTNGTFEVASGNGNLNESMLDPSSFGIGEHQVSYSSDDGTCKYLVDFTIRVNTDCLPCNALEIEASKTVTANYDGVNDFFEIKVGEYCDYVFGLQVFNRWGRIVYESSDYRNDWSGFSPNNSFGSSRTLPSGTYYYIISVKDHELKPFDGYIYLGSD